MNPSGTAVGSHYQGDLGAEYFGWQRESGRRGAEIDAFKFRPHVRPTDTLVDFGCGGGFMLELLEAQRKIGIEPNEHARGEATARGLEVVASPAEIGDAVADVVISHHALEHALSPYAELRELRRILKPTGRLVLWLPLDDWRKQRRVTEDENHHLYTWTPLLLRNVLREAGFSPQAVRVVSHAWPQQHERLYRALPRPVFDAVCRTWAIVRRHRQVMAVATPEA